MVVILQSDAPLTGIHGTDELLSAYAEGRRDFTQAALFRADLENVTLLHAQLKDANAIQADFAGSNLEGADLRGANLFRANLSGANLNGANLERASLIGANLDRASLVGTNLSAANLFRATLTGASLSQASLSGANLEEVELERADLQTATFDEKTVWPNGFDLLQAGMQLAVAASPVVPLDLPAKVAHYVTALRADDPESLHLPLEPQAGEDIPIAPPPVAMGAEASLPPIAGEKAELPSEELPVTKQETEGAVELDPTTAGSPGQDSLDSPSNLDDSTAEVPSPESNASFESTDRAEPTSPPQFQWTFRGRPVAR
jgi:hypothetical protein